MASVIELPLQVPVLAGAQGERHICEAVASGQWRPGAESPSSPSAASLPSPRAFESGARSRKQQQQQQQSHFDQAAQSSFTSFLGGQQAASPQRCKPKTLAEEAPASIRVHPNCVLLAKRPVQPPRVELPNVVTQHHSSETGGRVQVAVTQVATVAGAENGAHETGTLPSWCPLELAKPGEQIKPARPSEHWHECELELVKTGACKRSEGEDGADEERAPRAGERPARRRCQQRGKQQAPFRFAGILGSVLGSVCFSFSMLCIKLMPDESEGLSEKTKLVMWRGVTITLLCSVTLRLQQGTIWIARDELFINALRSIFGFVGVYGSYVSLRYISIGDSTALVFSSPIWTSLLSYFILNEPLRWIQLLALPASMCGIVLIAHPTLLVNLEPADWEQATGVSGAASEILLANLSSSPAAHDLGTLAAAASAEPLDYDLAHRWPGIVVALLTSLIVSAVYIVLKFRKSTPIQTTTFWLGLTTISGSLLVQCFTGFGTLPSSLAECALIACNGLCSWAGQALMQWSLFYEDASVLSVVRTLDVAMSFALTAVFLDEQILWTSVLGAAIIAGVVVSTILNNWISSKFCAERSDSTEVSQLELDAESRANQEKVAPGTISASHMRKSSEAA